FFSHDPATTDISPLSLHDALPISHAVDVITGEERPNFPVPIQGTAQNSPQTFTPADELQRPGLLLLDGVVYAGFGGHCDIAPWRSEEHTSELQSLTNLVCRLLLEK